MLNLKQQAATVLVLFHISLNKDVCAAISLPLCVQFFISQHLIFLNFPFRLKIFHQVSHIHSVLMIKGSVITYCSVCMNSTFFMLCVDKLPWKISEKNLRKWIKKREKFMLKNLLF